MLGLHLHRLSGSQASGAVQRKQKLLGLVEHWNVVSGQLGDGIGQLVPRKPLDDDTVVCGQLSNEFRTRRSLENFGVLYQVDEVAPRE